MRLRPLQGLTRRARRPGALRSRTGSSHGVWSPTTLEPRRVHSPRFTSPGSFRPQGFSPSRRLSPRQDLPALFRAGNALGVRPSGGFPRRQVLVLVTPGSPHGVAPRCSPKRTPGHFPRRSRARGSRWPPAGSCSVSGSVSNGWRGPQPPTDPLLSFSSLGVYPTPARTRQAAPPLMRFRPSASSPASTVKSPQNSSPVGRASASYPTGVVPHLSRAKIPL